MVLGSRGGELGQEFRQRGRALEEVVEDGTELEATVSLPALMFIYSLDIRLK